MRFGRSGLIAASFMSLLGIGVGCQNKLYDENLALRQQVRELQAAKDAREERVAVAPTPVVPEPLRPVDREVRVIPAPVAPAPAPAPAPVAPPPAPAAPVDNGLGGLDASTDKITGATTVNFVGDALFDPGQATLKTTAKVSLDKVAAALKKQFAGKTVRVQGHTDSDPIKHSKWASNQELSKARAEAVRTYLVSKGVDAKLVASEGLGDSKPKDPANTVAAKAKNRRVEIVVLPN